MISKSMRTMRLVPNPVESDMVEALDMSQLRERRRKSPLIGERELHDFQYQVLLAISIHSPHASGLTVLDFIVREANAVPDHAQTYGAINRLIDRGFVRNGRKTKSTNGGPPVQKLVITAKGLEALAKKETQIRALNALCEKYRRGHHREDVS